MQRARAARLSGQDALPDYRVAGALIVEGATNGYRVRQAQHAAFARLSAALPEQHREAFIRAAHPGLFFYLNMYDDIPAMLAAALKSAALEPAKRDALSRVEAEYWSARIAAAAQMEPLYRATIEPAEAGRYWRLVTETWARGEQVKTSTSEAESAFEEASQRWKDRCKAFIAALQEITGEVPASQPEAKP